MSVTFVFSQVVVGGSFANVQAKHQIQIQSVQTVKMGASSSTSKWHQLPGELVQVSFDGSQLCGVNAGGMVWCADENLESGNPNWRHIQDYSKWATVAGDRVWTSSQGGLGSITQGNAHGDPEWTTIEGLLDQMTSDGNILCGINFQNDLWCTTTTFDNNDPAWERVAEGSYKQVEIHDGTIYAVALDNTIWFAELGEQPWTDKEMTKIPGLKFKQVAVDADRVCGVNFDDDVKCAERREGGSLSKWYRVGSHIAHMDIHSSRIVAVDQDGNIFVKLIVPPKEATRYTPNSYEYHDRDHHHHGHHRGHVDDNDHV